MAESDTFVGDVGGTNARCALVDASQDGLGHLHSQLCAEFESPEAAIRAYLERVLPDVPLEWREFARHKRLREAIAHIVPGMEELADIDVAKREFHVSGSVLRTSDPRSHTPAFKSVPVALTPSRA